MDGRPKLNYDGADEPINKLRREFVASTFPPYMMKDLAAMGILRDAAGFCGEADEGETKRGHGPFALSPHFFRPTRPRPSQTFFGKRLERQPLKGSLQIVFLQDC